MNGLTRVACRMRLTSLTAVIVLCSAVLSAQTRIKPPDNKYTPAQDVQLGREAAQEIRQQLPILNDDEVTSYAEGLGRRLVGAIPNDLQHSEFRYTFEIVNVREINAFALPGGPMFINRGMIQTAATEGEIAGVMAHELSHVVLRHGTAQASKAQKYEVGSVLGQIAGAIIGGGWGQVVSGASQFGFGTAFLRFSREYEKQADLLGVQIMAAAGYDPRDMANVFKRIEEEGGSGGPQWLSDHPDPGNRIEYITEEAQRLRVTNATRDTRAFEQVQAHVKRMPAAPTTEEAAKSRGGSTGTSGRDVPRTGGRVAPPASSFRTYNEGNLFQIAVPSNWREMPNNNTVTFAPEGGSAEGSFTHGIQVGIARNESHDLEEATDELLQSLAQGNAISRPSGYDRVTIGGRRGLRTVVSNATPDGQESIAVFTTQLANGNLFYALGVAPQTAFAQYRNVFDKIAGSVRFAQ